MRLLAERHNPASVWTVPAVFRSIYAHAVEIPAGARTLLISGQFGIAPDGVPAPDFAGQLTQAMNNVEALLASARMSPADLVRIVFYLTRSADLAALGEIRRQRWASHAPPSVTVLVVAALARPDCLVEVEAMAAGPMS
jgi:enamine deaminase RidA (YjgF/YER057c/UK114 family)